ncbi:ESPR domain-containing protein [uncultured Parasutterella sp.]|uniref:ESPR domain-containing protein n=3 Tax=Parasutterella TaxID=577310 RepID=UPI00338EA182
MNKTYKVVFNPVTSTWTPVSEVSRSRGKSGLRSSLSKLAIAVACGLFSVSHAATYDASIYAQSGQTVTVNQPALTILKVPVVTSRLSALLRRAVRS